MGSSQSVEAWLSEQDAGTRAAIDALRALVRSARSDLTEHIKWNGPSFVQGGEDKVTIGRSPKGEYRVVLHRGAKSLPTLTLKDLDTRKLADWPAPDRGVIVFRDLAAIEAGSEDFADLVRRWLEATAT